jgi:hypothetical protein
MTARAIAGWMAAVLSVIAVPLFILTAIHDSHPGRIGFALFRALVLGLNGPARVLLWLVLSYWMSYSFVQWGDPRGSRKSWAMNALISLWAGVVIIVTVVLIAVGSYDETVSILARLVR